MRSINLQCRWSSHLLLVGLFYFSTALNAESSRPDAKRLAIEAEKAGRWEEACRYYEEALKQARNQLDCKEGLLRCTRRANQLHRLRDATYASVLQQLTPSQALDIYDQVLRVVTLAYIDPAKVDIAQLFQHGIEEAKFALESELFVQEYLPKVKATILDRCKQRLADLARTKLDARTDLRQYLALAREQVQAVLASLEGRGLDLKPRTRVALVMEFAAGACNGLDEYSLFFTPGSIQEMRQKSAGPGLEVIVGKDGLEIYRVYLDSDAYKTKGLQPEQRITRIDGQLTDEMTAEAATERLRGEEGTSVALEVRNPDEVMGQTVLLQRRRYVVPSVESGMLRISGDIGYIRIYHFQSSTPQEVKDALLDLQSQKFGALILDLRGNPGGSFDAAVKVAELFLNEGIIVHTQGTLDKFNGAIAAVKDLNPLVPALLPLRVLIDGNTASAAEVLAGALKERKLTRLVGEPSYGKCTIQIPFLLNKAPLQKQPAGVRLTVGRFSATGKFLDGGQGIVPHDKQDSFNALNFARDALRELTMKTMTVPVILPQ